ncbi:unnamed protein product [Haemonchus placei]|uniref:Calponin-homology (CH) domain-containing protein n=1 Tax=Haemonchus placei TaxID=6290 RepID=A0A158QK92_HAEPC|nr:unnamed protein product [Haemonchus placei]
MVTNVYVSAVTQDNISRHELLAWVNNLLKANFSKIEEMSTGAAYCQLTHLLFRDSISLRKVKWNSRNEMDHINNWKILGTAWKALGVDKPVLVERLTKAKFQDNFEFLQWFFKFFNANYVDECEEYDALAARGGETSLLLTLSLSFNLNSYPRPSNAAYFVATPHSKIILISMIRIQKCELFSNSNITFFFCFLDPGIFMLLIDFHASP